MTMSGNSCHFKPGLDHSREKIANKTNGLITPTKEGKHCFRSELYSLKIGSKRELFLLFKLTLSRIVLGRINRDVNSKEWFIVEQCVAFFTQLRDYNFYESYKAEMINLYLVYRCVKDTFPEYENVNYSDHKFPFIEEMSLSLFHPRNFPCLENRFNVKRFLLKTNLMRYKAPKAKPYIGVGYKDHGSRRDISNDGSPSWQEVAARHISSDDEPPEWVPYLEDLNLISMISVSEFYHLSR